MTLPEHKPNKVYQQGTTPLVDSWVLEHVVRGSIRVVCMKKTLLGEIKSTLVISTHRRGLVFDYRLGFPYAYNKKDRI